VDRLQRSRGDRGKCCGQHRISAIGSRPGSTTTLRAIRLLMAVAWM